jgi:ribose transport system ATP-binding protein
LQSLGTDIDPAGRVQSLGVAEQQMVEVAKALSLDARILIMDEPTSALTESEIEQLFAAIRRLTAAGVSVIYISHRLEELGRIGQRVTVLRDGRYIETRPLPAPLPPLVRLMANRDISEHFPQPTRQRGKEILRVDGVSRGSRLRDISFTLHRGEILGVAGLLGAGRTELARVIAGADRPDAGRIFLNGKPLRLRAPGDAIRAGIGLVPEDRKTQGLIAGLSVAANLALPQLPRLSRFGVVSRRQVAALAFRWIRELRVRTPGIDAPAATLSGGNQQKVVLAKALAGGAAVLVVDEPTRGIDVGAKMEIYALLDKLAAAGAGILMISSELPEIMGMSDRILVMHQGRVRAEFEAREASQERVLHAALGLAS